MLRTLTTTRPLFMRGFATRAAVALVPSKDKSPNAGPSAGVHVLRPLGIRENRRLGRMLLLDHAVIPEGTGFPDHPHRGLTTVTYVLHGEIEHEDFLGSYGLLSPGDAQWMTAGKGIMHAEVPRYPSPSGRDTEILQLWVDLPAKDKVVDPSYYQRNADEIESASFPGGSVKVVAGESHGISAPVREHGGCWYLDFHLTGGDVSQPLPADWDAFIYVLQGEVTAGGKKAGPNTAIVLDKGEEMEISSSGPARAVLIATEPLDQEVVYANGGLFSLTSKEEAERAMADWEAGKNGFEGAREWKSTIAAALRARKPTASDMQAY